MRVGSARTCCALYIFCALSCAIERNKIIMDFNGGMCAQLRAAFFRYTRAILAVRIFIYAARIFFVRKLTEDNLLCQFLWTLVEV